jgi:hypothetical protein
MQRLLDIQSAIPYLTSISRTYSCISFHTFSSPSVVQVFFPRSSSIRKRVGGQGRERFKYDIIHSGDDDGRVFLLAPLFRPCKYLAPHKCQQVRAVQVNSPEKVNGVLFPRAISQRKESCLLLRGGFGTRKRESDRRKCAASSDFALWLKRLYLSRRRQSVPVVYSLSQNLEF